ncbi:MAG: hypothetical protein KAT14_05935 [Candidatus Marinimicrobia bacterium]|nr:hypothetical protein [Candidatus Neomarinimicrobiota bacterium]
MKKRTSILIISLLVAGSLFAAGRMQEEDCINPRYYQFMVYSLTENLNLTSQQAEKLFPIMRPYREAKRQCHNKMIALSEEVYQQDNINKSHVQYYKNEIRRLHQEGLELDEAFYAKIETFLSPEQVAKAIFFEQHFRSELSRELKKRHHMPNDMPKKKQNYWFNKRNK